MDEDTQDAAWAQQELEERAMLEEQLGRHRHLLKASRAELEQFIRDNAAWRKRITAPAVNERKVNVSDR